MQLRLGPICERELARSVVLVVILAWLVAPAGKEAHTIVFVGVVVVVVVIVLPQLLM